MAFMQLSIAHLQRLCSCFQGIIYEDGYKYGFQAIISGAFMTEFVIELNY